MEITKLFLLVICLQQSLSAQCFNYYKAETYNRPDSSYCLPIIKWPISDQTLMFANQYDNKAYQNYQILLNQYYQTGKVSLDCLGISQYFFCADAYPTCNTTVQQYNGQQIQEICSWMCDLFQVRCGSDNKFYRNICIQGRKSETYCSYQNFTSIIVFLLFLFTLFSL